MEIREFETLRLESQSRSRKQGITDSMRGVIREFVRNDWFDKLDRVNDWGQHVKLNGYSVSRNHTKSFSPRANDGPHSREPLEPSRFEK